MSTLAAESVTYQGKLVGRTRVLGGDISQRCVGPASSRTILLAAAAPEWSRPPHIISTLMPPPRHSG